MEALKKNKTLLYTFVVTLIIFLGYFLFMGSGISLVSQAPDASTSTVGTDILASLQELSSAQINMSLFASPAWASLQDISAGVPTDAPGKTDLFGPVGSR